MPFIAHNPLSGSHDLPGHPETAVRAAAILALLQTDELAATLPRIVPDRAILRDEALSTHTPRVWLNLQSMDATTPTFLDPDTYMVAGSFAAAAHTARLGVLTVDRAFRGEPGFVVARPPGHHATADRSMGFCLLNNVAIACNHALERGAQRVLVFDHDVHHGNGTQDIFYASDRVLYQSFHLGNHYPGTGRVVETGSGVGAGFSVNAPLDPGDGDAEVRSLLHNVFLPIAKSYRPDLVLFSSGFDSLLGDPLGGLRLSPAFFGEMVKRFQEVAPRLVCFLEGGYQPDLVAAAALEQVRAMSGAAPVLGRSESAPGCQEELRRRLRDHWPVLA